MIYKTKHFNRWARKTGLHDQNFLQAISEIQQGLIDADLGGGVIKKRIALSGHGKRGSTRTLLATNKKDKWFFIYGFEKNERANISDNELEALKLLSNDLLKLSNKQIIDAEEKGALIEIRYET